MTIVLVGGGPDLTPRGREGLAPFLRDCHPSATVGVILAGDHRSAERCAPAYLDLMGYLAGRARVLPLADVTAAALNDLDALVVGGGPTPDYHRALAPHAEAIRSKVAAGAPYLGFSAGAAIAARTSIVGGYQHRGHDVCPVDWSEGLTELTLLPGLGLAPFTVEVHAAQAGTLGRAAAAAVALSGTLVIAIDEDTTVACQDDGDPLVLGTGQAIRLVANEGNGVTITYT